MMTGMKGLYHAKVCIIECVILTVKENMMYLQLLSPRIYIQVNQEESIRIFHLKLPE